jgi:hypothetical protein
MLEALQLLVKPELFVVLVAIDARFVTLALEKNYKGILTAGGHPNGLDYLEKIIQLPYRLPPIEKAKAMSDYLASQMGTLERDPQKLEQKLDDDTTRGAASSTRDQSATQQEGAKGNSPPAADQESSQDAEKKLPTFEPNVEGSVLGGICVPSCSQANNQRVQDHEDHLVSGHKTKP